MLIDLCRKTGATVLRTGTGATRYLDRAQLDAAGIAVEVAAYACPPYPQGPGPFTPRLAAEPALEAAGAYPPWMFGWRPRAGRVEALGAAAAHLAAGRTWVADLDVEAATSGAELEDVMRWTARWISDGSFLRLVRLITASLPAPLSPGSGLTTMLTNLRLARADQQLDGLPVIRFTDNYTVFCAGRREAGHAADRITAALAAAGLRPNQAKSKIWQPNPEDLYLAG